MKRSLLLWFGCLAGATVSVAQPGTFPGVEVVRTESFEVRLSHQDGLPQEWLLIDPIVLRTEPEGSAGVSLIVDWVSEASGTRPLELLDGTEQGVTAPSIERREDDDAVTVSFRWPVAGDGLVRDRTYRFPRAGFVSHLMVSYANAGTRPLRLEHDGRGPVVVVGPGLGEAPESAGGLGGSFYAYVRPVTYADGKVVLLDPETSAPAEETGFRWGGLHSRYFASLVIDDPGHRNRLRHARARLASGLPADRLARPDDRAYFPLLELAGVPLELAPGENLDLGLRLYWGPKSRDALRAAGAELDELLFSALWGWLRWLCFILMAVLQLLYAALHSWGLAIIALAVVVRIVTFPVAQVGLEQQARTAAEQARLKPFIDAIEAEHKDDAGRKAQELMRLYKEHGVSPFGAFKGCLWVVVQIPIFVALFNLLGQAFELRGASFLWIRDLAEPDRLFPLGIEIPLLGSYFNLLPILMAGTQVLVTQLSPAPASDEAASASQKRMMFFLAAVFLVLFYSFPAGLVLYWMTSNLGQLGQQWLLRHRLVQAP